MSMQSEIRRGNFGFWLVDDWRMVQLIWSVERRFNKLPNQDTGIYSRVRQNQSMRSLKRSSCRAQPLWRRAPHHGSSVQNIGVKLSFRWLTADFAKKCEPRLKVSKGVREEDICEAHTLIWHSSRSTSSKKAKMTVFVSYETVSEYSPSLKMNEGLGLTKLY
jgi:hypothetical protein